MITYRDYSDSDWQSVCQIHDSARPDELKGSCDPRGFIPIEQDEEVEDLKTCRKFVACDNETVVGFIGVDDKYLAWLYIDPSNYGKVSDENCCVLDSARSATAHGPSSSTAIIQRSNSMNRKGSGKCGALPVKTTATLLPVFEWKDPKRTSWTHLAFV